MASTASKIQCRCRQVTTAESNANDKVGDSHDYFVSIVISLPALVGPPVYDEDEVRVPSKHASSIVRLLRYHSGMTSIVFDTAGLLLLMGADFHSTVLDSFRKDPTQPARYCSCHQIDHRTNCIP